MTQVPTIFVAHKTRLNLTEAAKFGVLRYACNETDPYPAPDEDMGKKAAIFADFEFNMREFNDSKDFLLMVGDPIYCGLLMYYAMNRTDPGDTLNVLRFDRLLGVYIPIEVKV